MNTNIIKSFFREISPNIILRFYRLLKYKNKIEYGFLGEFNSWDTASKASIGYDNNLILEKVKNSLLKVKNGEAIYERDSVIFDQIQYSWPLLASLLYIYNTEKRLQIIDFGGSLGSTYYQNKKFLDSKFLSWNIVEQENFVECGKELFEDNILKFYLSVDECLKQNECNTILFSSSIQYIKDPFELLNYIIEKNFKYILFDRTSFFINESISDQIKIQKVPPEIYEASYPSWIFNYDKFINFFNKKYILLEEFESQDKYNLSEIIFKGFIFKRKSID